MEISNDTEIKQDPNKEENTNTEDKPASTNQTGHTDENVKEIHHHHHYYRKGMNLGRIFFGALIVIIGLAYLGKTTGIFPYDLNLDWEKLWPIIIVLAGLAILSRGLFSAIVGSVIFLGLLVIMGIVIYGNVKNANEASIVEPISILKENGILKAELSIDSGAGTVFISGNGAGNKLISGDLNSNFMKLAVSNTNDGNTQKVGIKENGSWTNFGKHENKLDLKLDTNTVFDIMLKSGASTLNLDLSEIKTQKIDIATGASSLNINLGDTADKSALNIDAGASTININIPQTVGVKLRVSSGLSSKNLSDFNKIDQENYESNNYSETKKKINIDLDLGVSRLDINWR